MTSAQIKRAYIHSRFLYDQAVTELERRTSHLDWDNPDAIDAIIDFEMDVRESLNMRQIHDDLMAAETILLNWAKERVKNDPATAAGFATNAHDIERVFNTRLLSIRQKVITLSLQLEEKGE